MIPPHEGIEKPDKHVFTHAFLETPICSERPTWSVLGLGLKSIDTWDFT